MLFILLFSLCSVSCQCNMIIKAQHHCFLYPFFRWYGNILIRRNFQEVRIESSYSEQQLPVLLLMNHFSWWDGFFASYLNDRIFRRRFHFMMIEEQLKKHWYFRYTGGFSVRKNSRSVIDSLHYAAELLENKNNVVLIFPQGQLQSHHKHEFTFQKGVVTILKKCTRAISIVLGAVFIDFRSFKNPSLFLYLQSYVNNSSVISLSDIENTYNTFFQNCLHKTILFVEKEELWK